MKVNGREDIGNLGSRDVEFGEEFYLPARNLWIDAQLSGCRHKIFLQNLK